VLCNKLVNRREKRGKKGEKKRGVVVLIMCIPFSPAFTHAAGPRESKGEKKGREEGGGEGKGKGGFPPFSVHLMS